MYPIALIALLAPQGDKGTRNLSPRIAVSGMLSLITHIIVSEACRQ
jgi:hypothetical protein